MAGLWLAGCDKKPAPTPGASPSPAPQPAASAEPSASAAPTVAPTATPPPTPAPTPEDPLATPIGFFAPLSGPQASFGSDSINGARLAVDEINASGGILGHPLKLIVKDTQSLPDETATVVKELIDKDKVVALIGEIATDRSLVAAPIAQARGVPMITPASTHQLVTAAGNFVFRACYTDSFQAAVMAKFARSIDVEKAAVLFDPTNAYGIGLADIFKRDFLAHHGTIVAEQTYRAGDTDFTSQLTLIKSANPEVIFLPSYFAEAALVIKQARQLGIDTPFIGTDGWDSPEFLRIGGTAVDNSYFSSHFSAESQDPKVAGFVATYGTKYNAPPPPLAALTYDSVYLVAEALKRAGQANPVALREALAGTKDFVGVTGQIAFDQDRNPRKSAVVIRLQDGKFTYLETVQP